MKTTAVFVGSRSEFNFFSRMRDGFAANGYRLIMLTCKPSLWYHAVIRGIQCGIVNNSSNVNGDQHVRETTEVMTKSVGEESATRFYCGVMEHLSKIHGQNAISLILIWNGNSIPAKAMSVFAQYNNIPALYFELSNIPGKIFVDPKGVNAQSLLFQKPGILDFYSLNAEEFDDWREKYLEYKRGETITPHAVRSRRIANLLFPFDALAVRMFDLPEIGEMCLIKKIGSMLNSRALRYSFDRYDMTKRSFNFFPMQILSDSQLIKNSSMSIQDAVSIAYERSRDQKRDLVIKPHPVERDAKAFEFLDTLKGTEGLFVVNEPTFSIVERCEEIITINSTVGLEGLIIGKKVTFLGSSYYSSMNPERMMKYLLWYLVDIDYFSHKTVSAEQVNEVLSRLRIK